MGAALTLTYDEDLNEALNEALDEDPDEDPAPVLGAFTVMVGNAARTVSQVSVDGSAVTLTLASAVAAGQTVTVSYTPPATDPIRDIAENIAAAFADWTVRERHPGNGAGRADVA